MGDLVSFKSFDRFYFLYCDGSLLVINSGAEKSLKSFGRLWDRKVSLSAAILINQKLVLLVKDNLSDDFRDTYVNQKDFNCITFMKADGSLFLNPSILSTTFESTRNVHLNFIDKQNESFDDNDKYFNLL